MSALVDSGMVGSVEWIGSVRDRQGSLRSSPRESVELGFAGIDGESHGGLNRPACVRVEALYPPDTAIRNTRQLTLLSAEELGDIAAETGLRALSPALLGANFVIRGIASFTLIPPSSRLLFASGGAVTVDMENLPCNYPAREIEIDHPGHGRGFKAAARRRRGVTGWVEREGPVALNDEVRLFIPAQPPWPARPVGGTGP